jgi:hypothetical protein
MQLRGEERAALQIVYKPGYALDNNTFARLATTCTYLVLQRFRWHLARSRQVHEPEDLVAIGIEEFEQWLNEDPDPADVFLGVGVHRGISANHVSPLRTALALVMGQAQMVLRFYKTSGTPYDKEIQGFSAWLRSDNPNGCVALLVTAMIEDVNSNQAVNRPD